MPPCTLLVPSPLPTWGGSGPCCKVPFHPLHCISSRHLRLTPSRHTSFICTLLCFDSCLFSALPTHPLAFPLSLRAHTCAMAHAFFESVDCNVTCIIPLVGSCAAGVAALETLKHASVQLLLLHSCRDLSTVDIHAAVRLFPVAISATKQLLASNIQLNCANLDGFPGELLDAAVMQITPHCCRAQHCCWAHCCRQCSSP